MDTPLLNMDTFYDPSGSISSGFECIDNMNYTAIYWVFCFTNSQKVKEIMHLVSTKYYELMQSF